MNKEHSLFIAYIVCLVMCILAKIVSLYIPEWAFQTWNRVVVAATVSTVYFCCADTINQTREMKKLMNLYYAPITEKNKRLEQWLNEKDKSLHEKIVDRYVDDLRKRVTELIVPISEVPDKRKIDYVFIFNCVGFLIFFFVLVFDYFYNVFSQGQDVLTMVAFTVVMISTVLKDALLNKINRRIREMSVQLDKLELAISLDEIYNNTTGVGKNGKDENANK